MSVNNNSLRTIDGENVINCDSIEISEEIILNGDNGELNEVIYSDGVKARWASFTSLLTAGTGINIAGSTISTANIPNGALTNSTISGKALGTNLDSLTKGTNITFSSGTTYNGSSAITISSTDTNTEYTAGTGLTLSAGNEFSTNEIPNSDLENSTISGKELGTNLANLTKGTNITFSAGTTYNGSSAITISSTDTNTEYTAGTGLSLSAGNEFRTNLSTLTAGTNLTFSAGTTYNGTAAITLNARAYPTLATLVIPTNSGGSSGSLWNNGGRLEIVP